MAKTLAAERGINLADITGTGPEGRITASDVEAYKAPAGGKKEGAKSEKKKDEGPKIGTCTFLLSQCLFGTCTFLLSQCLFGTCTFLLSQCLFAHPQELRSRVPECEHERQHAPCMS
jgi:pyruvate/2-oxoglutarate dehydrogenase complex dihydrolipoamide acyltransferase (E2) component